MIKCVWVLAFCGLVGFLYHGVPEVLAYTTGPRIALDADWAIESSLKLPGQSAQKLSQLGVDVRTWHRANTPATVLGALVNDGTYPDPFNGMNFRSIPGTDYPIGAVFARLPMSATSPFKAPWFFRKEFTAPLAASQVERVYLHLDGINYRANIWLNGHSLSSAQQTVGMFRAFEFEIAKFLNPGGKNVLLLEISAPEPNDLAGGWVDWNPMPADKNMGIWRPVYLSVSGSVKVRDLHVVAEPVADMSAARVRVRANVSNHASQTKTVSIIARIEPGNIVQKSTVQIAADTNYDFNEELTLNHPEIWWPRFMGDHPLYTATVQVFDGDQPSDHEVTSFGVRKITSNLNQNGYRQFYVNDRPVLVRGAGWANDIFLRTDSKRLKTEFDYIKDLGLNALRLEGHFETEEFFNLADQAGILIIAGWSCCDHWEQWPKWNAENHAVARASLRDQITRMRNHPAMLAWLNGSDYTPPQAVENAYLGILRDLDWQNPTLSSANGNAPSVITGKTGVKMTGPYEYVAPSYWMKDRDRGGAFGFNMETCPGASVPLVDSISRFIPQSQQWPLNATWDFHAGGEEFKSMRVSQQALAARQGQPSSIGDYIAKSQLSNYEAHRAMFEGFARNKFTKATGVIQWLLNSAWPNTIWHLYDYYLQPGGSYYGAKKGNQPLLPLYGYDDHAVWVVNHWQRAFTAASLSVRVFDSAMREVWKGQKQISIAADSSAQQIQIPPIQTQTQVYFVDLELKTEEFGSTRNFYWLSQKDDVLDWKKMNWQYTPSLVHADLRELETLPRVKLETSVQWRDGQSGLTEVAKVSITNPTRNLALGVQARFIESLSSGGAPMVGVTWDDNWVSLLPGETRVLTAQLPRSEGLRVKDPTLRPILRIDGWNIQSQ